MGTPCAARSILQPDVPDAPGICHPSHPAVRTWIDLQHFSARVQRLLSASLRRHGLNYGLFGVLMVTGAAEGLTQQDLADRLGLTKANVSQLLDRLEAASLVRRVPDGRAYSLYLTDASRSLMADVIPEQEELIASQFAALSPAEQLFLQGLIGRITHGHQPADLAADPPPRTGSGADAS